jgi:hypothetical protein
MLITGDFQVANAARRSTLWNRRTEIGEHAAGLCSNSQMWNIHTPNASLRVNGMPKNAGGSASSHFS